MLDSPTRQIVDVEFWMLDPLARVDPLSSIKHCIQDALQYFGDF